MRYWITLPIITLILLGTCRAKANTHHSLIDEMQQKRGSIVAVIADLGDSVNQGAGVVLSSNGLIVTNFHTINQAKRIRVRMNTELYTASVVRLFPADDLSLIQIRLLHPKFIAVPMENSNNLVLNQPILHVGNSYLLNGTISEGRITGLGTSRQAKNKAQSETTIIRINLNLYKGDSGGPLFNRNGQLIGMMVAKDITRNGISYAIPSNKIKKLLLNLDK